ncbi:MAG: cation:proton antiporter [Myxococcota bacterium]|jgi:CPA2 family monovalent cation:H+ antiporter-2|nr:cation:proton antiporter [Myxococcota bacterium]
MAEIPLLQELVILTALGAAVTVALSKLRLPTVAGLLTCGALVGPSGFGIVDEPHAIEVLAEIGVVLLLFTIGLEFSLDHLRHIFRRVALGGLVQVLGTTAATVAVATFLGVDHGKAVFFGFVMALSSTAIVLRALSGRGELDAPHGKFIVGTLIFQDLCVVPMVLLVPVLGSDQPPLLVARDIGLALGKAALVVVGALLVSRAVVPRLLRIVDASRSREVFLLTVLSLCIGTAWLTSLTGLSLALGAFIGGMVVAGTEFRHRAMGDIIPLRDVFVSVFFISLGMLFDVRLLLSHPILIALLVLAFTVGKAIIAIIAALVMRFPVRAAWLAGLALGQFGEFGFVLVSLGTAKGLVTSDEAGPLLSAGILSMFLAPLLINAAPALFAGERLLAPLSRLLRVRGIEEVSGTQLKDHVVVVGYGVAGQQVARSLTHSGLSHVVLELNAETVRRARKAGDPVFYADATSLESLAHARVQEARAVAVLINDPDAAARVVDAVRRCAPRVPVLIRARFHAERDKLVELGATDVIADEVEACVEMITRLLRRLEVPRNVIHDRLREVRAAMQTSERKITIPRASLPEHEALADLKIDSVVVPKHGRSIGLSLRDLNLRQRTGATIIAIRRSRSLLEKIDPDEPLHGGDVVYIVGSGETLSAAVELLTALHIETPPPPS